MGGVVPQGSANRIDLELLRHLSAHPNAEDDLEGLVGFWLLERRLLETRAEVVGALEDLVKRGLVVTVVAADGRVRYRRAPNTGQKGGT